MMVVWHHALIQVPGTTDFIPLSAWGWGHLGVDLFFMISGFIMVHTTWGKPVTPWQFISNRIRRIVPLYWTATLAMIGLALVLPSQFRSLRFDAVSVVKSLGFVPFYSLSDPGVVFPVLKPGWTLNYEMFFYLLFALSMLLARRWRVPSMVALLGCLVGLGYLYAPTNAILSVYTGPKLIEFGFGMVIARWWLARTVVSKSTGG